MDNKYRVLVGCITHDKDELYINDFLNAVRSQDYKNIDILFVDTSGNSEYCAKLRGTGAIVIKSDVVPDAKIKRITLGRNLIRDFALGKSYDFVWFVDNDIIPSKNALSIMLSKEKDVLAGICLINMNIEGTSKILPNIYLKDEKNKCLTPLSINAALSKSMLEIDAAGMGCVLVSKKVLSTVSFRYFEDSMAGEDVAFFSDAKKQGFLTFVDNSVKCNHLVFPPGDPRNKKFMFESYEKGQ